MRIFLVYHDLSFRGGERLFATLAKGLIKKGHSVYLVAGRIGKNPRPFSSQVKIIRPPGLFNKLFGNNWLFVIFSMPITLINILRVIPKIETVYTAEGFLALWPAIIAATLFRKKLVLSVFELGSTKTNFINTFFVKQVKNAVTVNSTLVPALEKTFKIPNVRSVPAGIDAELFKKANPYSVIKRYKLDSKKILFMPGLINRHKMQDLAIEILSEVKKEFPETALIIAGSGDEKYLEELRTLVKKLKLEEKDVVFAGFVPENDLKHYYAASDLVLMCGPIAGLTIIEALFCNKLTIYPTSGHPPLGPVEEYGLGFIVKDKKASSFSKKIVTYLKNPHKFSKKLQKDKKLAVKEHSLESFTNRTLDVLKHAQQT